MPEGITVRGLAEAQRTLKEFPRTLVMGCFSKALSRAAAVFEEELRTRTPESEAQASEETGHLVDFIMDEITIDPQARGGRVSIGFGNLGMRALWVEYGHRLLGHKPGRKNIGSVRAHPFMRPAFEAAADRAVEAFADAVREYMSSGSVMAA